MGFELVGDVVRHLKPLDFTFVSDDVGILTNSATQKSNLYGGLVSTHPKKVLTGTIT
jgi:hypothetical protein